MTAFIGNILTIVLAAWLSFASFLSGSLSQALSTLETNTLVSDTALSLQLSPLIDSEENLASSYTSLSDLLTSLSGETASTSSEKTVEENSETVEPAEVVDATPEEPENLAEAIVNIYCTHTTSKYKRTISGTGFFISDRGVILTNAHVAQFLLLENLPKYGKVSCMIRVGKEATATYDVSLLYISPSWVLKHAELINEEAPKGTGKDDFALLYVTGEVDGSSLPSHFIHLDVDTNYLPVNIKNQPVVIVGYPKTEGTTNQNLTRQVATTTVPSIYTFGSRYVDLMTLAGSSIGAQGASGGPVISVAGKVIGMISTRANDEKYGEGSLMAITTSYVERTLKEETTFGLYDTISGNLDNRAKLFGETILPILTGIFSEEI